METAREHAHTHPPAPAVTDTSVPAVPAQPFPLARLVATGPAPALTVGSAADPHEAAADAMADQALARLRSGTARRDGAPALPRPAPRTLARVDRTVRRVIDPRLAESFAGIMDQILKKPGKARSLAFQHRVLLHQLAADGAFTGRLDPDMATLLGDLDAHGGDAADTTDLAALVRAYQTAKGSPDWTHVAGASFTPKRQDSAATGTDTGTGPLYEDPDAQQEFQLGKNQGMSDLDALINFATLEIDKANAKHLDEVARMPALDQPKTVMVFLGPEWMFANRGTPILPAQRTSTIGRFRKLSILYPQMVLVPGTIRSGTPRKAVAGQFKDIRNTVFVVWNGKLLHTHDKQGDAGDTDVDGVGAPIKRYGGDGKEMAKDPTFTLNGLKFAIDICADHSSDRAKKATGTGPEANVHLVTGWGQIAETVHAATDTGGPGVMIGSDAEGSGPNFVDGTVKETMPGNRTAPTMPPRATVGGGALVPEPGYGGGGNQILTGHALNGGSPTGRNGKAVLTYYAPHPAK